MTENLVRTQTRSVILKVRIDEFPPGAVVPAVVAVLEGILALVSVGTVLAPEIFAPTNGPRKSDDSPIRIVKEDPMHPRESQVRLPIPPSFTKQVAGELNGTWSSSGPRRKLDREAPGVMSAEEPVLAFVSEFMEISYYNFSVGVNSVGWLLDVQSLRYGSPFELTVEAAIPTAAATRAVGFIRWIVDGPNPRRRRRVDSAFVDAEMRLAECKTDFLIRKEEAAIREAEALARIAEAEARLIEMDVAEKELRLKLESSRVEAERQRLRRAIGAIEDELADKSSLIEAYDFLRSFRDMEGLEQWSDDDLAKLAVIPGFREAVRFANVAKLQAKVVKT